MRFVEAVSFMNGFFLRWTLHARTHGTREYWKPQSWNKSASVAPELPAGSSHPLTPQGCRKVACGCLTRAKAAPLFLGRADVVAWLGVES